jgi:hypothetical protein
VQVYIGRCHSVSEHDLVVEPRSEDIGCDGTGDLTQMTWSRWGPDDALGTGFIKVNDCDPYCAGGTYHQYPVIVHLTDAQVDPASAACAPNTLWWAGMLVAFPHDTPHGFGPPLTEQYDGYPATKFRDLPPAGCYPA